MKRLFAIVLPLLWVLGCSPPISVNLSSNQRFIPEPVFLLTDKSNEGEKPSYSRVKVYEQVDSCSVPDCPLLWEVVVPLRYSPNKFHYGRNLGFGTITLIPAKNLKLNRDYTMLLTSSLHGNNESVEGRFHFRVDERGQVVSRKK